MSPPSGVLPLPAVGPKGVGGVLHGTAVGDVSSGDCTGRTRSRDKVRVGIPGVLDNSSATYDEWNSAALAGKRKFVTKEQKGHRPVEVRMNHLGTIGIGPHVLSVKS